MQPAAESHDALIQSGGHTDGGGGAGGDGVRPEMPDQESQDGAPPHAFGDGAPGQPLSQSKSAARSPERLGGRTMPAPVLL